MSNPVQNLFTAAQIARAVGISRQAVNGGLEQVGALGQVEAGGKEVGAWSFQVLPIDWQLEITRRGVRRGFENGEQFLASLPRCPWKAPLPWDRVPQREQDKAAKLQKALARALQLRTEGLKGSDLEQVGLEDFRKACGYPLQDGRHWRRLLQRTIERDGGEENWQRLEIYLDDRAFRVTTNSRQALQGEYQHQALGEVITALENRQAPTSQDREFLWDAVFRHYEAGTETLTDSPAGNKARRLFRASLLCYLYKAFPAGVLCASQASLKRRFNEKLLQWRDGGRTPAAVRDMRAVNSGNFQRADISEDLKKIRNLAIQLDGNESLAHRMLRERGELSQAFCESFDFDSRRNKSALPESVRDGISAEVDMVLPLRRGPWQAKMRGPYIPRDWSGVKPGDWFNADDVTWNHYFKEQLPDGRWTVMRGECLLMTDLRTGYPLDFLLVSGKYNGEHVRSLALKVHDRVGLPRCGFYFEKGVWASRLVTGDRRQGTPVHWREAENGLCSSGLKLDVRHATTPRAKPIEGLLRILQERMRCIFGFVGFNERAYDAERIQPLIARAQRGDAAALAQFPTAEEWAAKISDVLKEFAHDPQNGKMLEGQAPAEAWAAELRGRPLRRLADEARFMLSTHQRRVMVRQEGIVLTIRGKRHVYYNEHTGKALAQGRELLAFYNVEMPELLTCCDMNRQNYFSVRRVELPAMSATPEQLAEVNELRKAHMAPAKAIFGELKHEMVSTITRDNEHSAEEKALGRFHNEQAEQFKTEKNQTERRVRRARQKVLEAGFDPSRARLKNPEAVAEAAGRITSRLEALRAKEAEEAEQETTND